MRKVPKMERSGKNKVAKSEQFSREEWVRAPPEM